MRVSCLCAGSIAAAMLAAGASAQTALRSYYGAQPNQGLGASLADGGDMNGDGVHELLVGLKLDGATGRGAVNVYDGATGLLRFYLPSPVASATDFGVSVSCAGDADGDGLDDFIIGASKETSPPAVMGGAAYIYSGATGGLLRKLAAGSTLAAFGFVAGVGDVNGDGFDDQIVGAFNDDSFGLDRGSARVFSGADGSQLYVYSGDADFDAAGARVAGVGDVDLDGRPDFAYTSYFDHNPQGSNVGSVRVCSGRTGLELYAFFGQVPFAGYGTWLDELGDLDGDGHADILIGANDGPGHVYVRSGANGSLLRTFAGQCNDAKLGSYVAGLGDVDLDGVADVAASAEGTDAVQVFSGASGALVATYRTVNDNLYGQIPARIGDMNGDGRADLAIGCATANEAGPLAGKVEIYVDGFAPQIGTPFGLGDGSGAPCPCGNLGGAGNGCANSTGVGARLRAVGTTSVWIDRFVLMATQMPTGKASVLITGPSTQNGGLGVQFFDGLLGTGGQIKRLGAKTSCLDGASNWGPGLISPSGWIAGQTRNFQVWYRDPLGPCGSAANISNGLSLTLTP